MCTTCGCGTDDVHIDGQAHTLARVAPVPLTGEESFVPALGGARLGIGAAGVHGPGVSAARIVQVERDLLAANDAYASRNRAAFAARDALCLNLVSSPGAGKTTLLVRTIQQLGARLPVAVVEGDQQTSVDADRIRAAGAPAVQINTGKGCHLDAHMLARALERLEPPAGGVLFVENVGNLVCPALFDLGEAHKVAILSVTEGEDKPLKYPDMFRAANLMLVNKIDLLPHLDFDVELCERNARRVHPQLTILRVSGRTGEGFAAWLDWIERELQLRASRPVVAEAEPRV
jgi:hydrogenase nickel incorporation protein HypB